MKNIVKTGLAALIGAALATGAAAQDVKYAWYASTVHPYFDEVQTGVDQFAIDYDVEVFKRDCCINRVCQRDGCF